jgi:hypothetical protein
MGLFFFTSALRSPKLLRLSILVRLLLLFRMLRLVDLEKGVGVCVVTGVTLEEVGKLRELGRSAGAWNVTIGGCGGDGTAAAA